ncbi:MULTISPECIES: bacterial proteasome activator family protein [unclassified Knoellia]|uniref:bacterial proteasome activator family protein n=1 Tax=Knoellia altitudinis TaxID=3404795 RepID=UPI003605BB60
MADMSDQPRQPTDPSTEQDSQEAREVHGTATIDDDKVVVVTPEGMGIADRDPEGKPSQNPADLVEQPAKVMRIGSMIKQLLEEVRNAPLDEKGRARLADVHERSLSELKDGLAPELVEELERISLPFSEDAPSDAELRVAQAQLVGWLEGLFHGIQTALVAQQMAAQAQLQQMRQLPPGHAPAPGQPSGPMGMPTMPSGPPAPGEGGHAEGTGQYL